MNFSNCFSFNTKLNFFSNIYYKNIFSSSFVNKSNCFKWENVSELTLPRQLYKGNMCWLRRYIQAKRYVCSYLTKRNDERKAKLNKRNKKKRKKKQDKFISIKQIELNWLWNKNFHFFLFFLDVFIWETIEAYDYKFNKNSLIFFFLFLS